MRSGSTLLKALLATADDVAHLPEIDFQKTLIQPKCLHELERTASEPILLLKRPCWFNETKTYPRIPDLPPVRCIVLIRDAYETVRSVGRMLIGRSFDRLPGAWGYRWIALRYWAPVTQSLLETHEARPSMSILTRYEALMEQPEEQTVRIFNFLGSEKTVGTRSYETPENFRWKWGSDDGSARIRTKTVQPPRTHTEKDLALKAKINSLPPIQRLREKAGLTDYP
ncbi:MAG: hypothetical protein AAGJ81_04370 [Verrucomicrobiota bacterium]